MSLTGAPASVLVAACMLLLGGCGAPEGDLAVAVPPHIAVSGPSALARAAPRNVALPPFGDATADPGRIGARSTSGNPGGSIVITPTPGELLHDAFAAELRRAGHTIAREAGVTIEGKVTTFTIRVSPNALGWQMVVEAGVAITARTDEMTVNHAYATRCADRSYSTPGAGAIAAVVGHCVNDLAVQFSNDTDVAHVLGAP
jgi:uncharacterized lipoprotein YajG